MSKKMTYIALVGMNTPTGRFEPGEVVTGIPPGTVDVLIAQHAIAVKGGAGDPDASGVGLGVDSDTGEGSGAVLDAPAASDGGAD